mgnify:CR=1 FL=1
MPQRLTQENKSAIIEMIIGFHGKISWQLIIDEIFVRLGIKVSRQALDRHSEIKRAYEVRKKSIQGELSNKPQVRTGAVALVKSLEKIQRLESKNEILIAENKALKEQFIVWAYNAYIKGLDEEKLNQPLPPINRDRSR